MGSCVVPFPDFISFLLNIAYENEIIWSHGVLETGGGKGGFERTP